MTDGPITARRNGVVAVLTIDHPPVNAMSLVARQGLIDAVRAADADPSVSAIVVTGAGSCFIAGADMREMNAPLQSPSCRTSSPSSSGRGSP